MCVFYLRFKLYPGYIYESRPSLNGCDVFSNSLHIIFIEFFFFLQDVFNLLPNLNVNELIKAFAGNLASFFLI
jgi:hypothetical protein